MRKKEKGRRRRREREREREREVVTVATRRVTLRQWHTGKKREKDSAVKGKKVEREESC